jgi:hypothetical protein
MLRFKDYLAEAYHSDTYGAIGSDPEFTAKRKYGSASPEAVERIKKKKEAEKKETGLYKKQTQSQRDAYVKNQMAALKHIPEAKTCNCWDGYKRVPGTKPCEPGSCVKESQNEEVDLEEATPYYNKPSFLKKMSRVAKQERQAREKKEAEAKKPVKEETMDEAAIDAKGHKSSTGGLTQKGRDAYNAKGANLQAPVTTPPSKLKAGSKAYNRRKSFCARMGGMEGPMKKPNGEPTRKALALRKWNC